LKLKASRRFLAELNRQWLTNIGNSTSFLVFYAFNFKIHSQFFSVWQKHPTFAVLKIQSENGNHQATKKDVRQATKRRDSNRYYGKTTRNAIRDLKELKDNKSASGQLPDVISMIDKLAKKGIIHKNKAANIKSKLTRRVNGLATA
jgi:small subunit ribosomal protein S20